MTIYAGGPRIRRTKYLEEFTAPLGDVLAAQALESWTYAPTSSLLRMNELFAAEHAGEVFPTRGGPVRIGGEPSPLLSASDARARVKATGLDIEIPDEGMREGVLAILLERKREERRRADILGRAPQGIGTWGLRIATALGTSMLDPLNVASAFVPVGWGAYASALARAGTAAGRAAVRARFGAVEGAVGAAMVEPIVYAAAQQEQADYDLLDSLMAVGFGTALGGGLHIGAGVLSDAVNPARWRAYRPQDGLPATLDALPTETRSAALKTAVAQMAGGRAVEIEALLRTIDPSFGIETRPSFASAAVLAQSASQRYGIPFRVVEDTGAFRVEPIRSQDVARPRQGALAEPPKAGPVAETAARARMQRYSQKEITALIREATGLQAKVEPTAADNLRLNELRVELAAIKERGGLIEATDGIVVGALNQVENLPPPSRVTRAVYAPGQPVGGAVEARQGAAGAPAAVPNIVAIERLRETSRRSQAPETARFADFKAADKAAERLAAAPKTEDLAAAEAELADAVQAAQDVAARLGLEAPAARVPEAAKMEAAPPADITKGTPAEISERIAAALGAIKSGEGRLDESGAGSRYYELPSGKSLRISNHELQSPASARDIDLVIEPDANESIAIVTVRSGGRPQVTQFAIEGEASQAWRTFGGDVQLFSDAVMDALRKAAGQQTRQLPAGGFVARELAPFDEAIEDADSWARAVEAAAFCRTRRG